MKRLAQSAAPVPAGYLGFSDLPALPSVVRYLDEYDDSVRTVANLAGSNLWRMEFDTRKAALDFSVFLHEPTRLAVKWFVVWSLKELSPRTSTLNFEGAKRLAREHGSNWLSSTLSMQPSEWAARWDVSFRNQLSSSEAGFLKSFLYFMCAFRIGAWHPGYEPLIRSLRFPWSPNYEGVRSGDSLLTVPEEAAVVGCLDDTAAAARDGSELGRAELLRHCLLAICYEHGLRPVQIARIALGDCRIYEDGHGQTVHFVAHRAKKRDGKDRIAFVRRIKREWVAPFVLWFTRRMHEMAGRTPTESDKLFPDDISSIITLIGDASEELSGTRRTATDFRHSVAQRLADSGASVEEVAHFLGHSQLQTSLVYFEHSQEQAEQVNKALAISPVYSALAEVARTRTIDKKRLLGLPPDNQVGAVPHGIPIAGIGGCDLGQSLCQLNPALSCYTCRKFIPVLDADLHREVLESFRGVARFFFDESRGDKQSPAFMQLRITLTAIQKVIEDLGQITGEQT